MAYSLGMSLRDRQLLLLYPYLCVMWQDISERHKEEMCSEYK